MKSFFVKALSALLVLCLTLAFAPVALMEETIEAREDAVENAAVEVAEEQASESTEEEAEPLEETIEADAVIETDTVDEVVEEDIAELDDTPVFGEDSFDLGDEEKINLDFEQEKIQFAASDKVLLAAQTEASASTKLLIFNQNCDNAIGGYNDGQQECRKLALRGSNYMGYWYSGQDTGTNSGCGIYSMAHAYQWVTGDKRTASNAPDLLKMFINNNIAGGSNAPWEGSLDTKYGSILVNKFGVKRASFPSSESSWLQLFNAGGAAVLNIPGHYVCAVGALSSSQTGTGEMWLHIVDSSCGSTIKRLTAAQGWAYGFVDHGKLQSSNGNGLWRGDEYYIPLSSYSKAGMSVVGAYLPAARDTTKPTITNAKVTNISSAGYTVTCNVSDNVGVTMVKFPTWTDPNVQDDLIWHVGTISGNTASFNVKVSDHNNETGCKYITHIYAYDAAGNFSSVGVSCDVPALDKTKPTISNVRVTNLTSSGYTVTCTVSDNVGVTKVQFPTWYEGQQGEDATWHNGTISGNTASCYIKVSDHNNKTGLNYHTDIYAWDAAGNMSASATARYNFVPNPTSVSTSGTKTDSSSSSGTKTDSSSSSTSNTSPVSTQVTIPTITVTRNAKAKVNVGTSYQIVLNGKTAKSFKSSKKKVATVSSDGLIVPKSKGKAKITIKLTNKKKYTLTLTVVDPTIPKSISLDKTGTVAAQIGQQTTLTAKLPAGTSSTIKWSSSNRKVATVDQNGNVSFKKAGKVTITATASRGKKKAKVKFKVSK